jgi:hypothetical protein
VTLVNPKVNDKWYNIKRFMGEKTQENSGMGYSAAYPTGRERFIFGRVEVERWRIRDGE